MLRARKSVFDRLDVVLASASPRRKELLAQVGLSAEPIPSSFPETLDKSHFSTPDVYVEENASRKAFDVLSKLLSAGRQPDVVIGSDTVVVQEGQILEKPEDEEHAKVLLRSLSDKTHYVVTAVCLLVPAEMINVEEAARSLSEEGFNFRSMKGVHAFHEKTDVTFGHLDDLTIEAYVATGEPMDKAGGYGIQGIAGSFVRRINGCYYNVVGFPLFRFCSELLKIEGSGRLTKAT